MGDGDDGNGDGVCDGDVVEMARKCAHAASGGFFSFWVSFPNNGQNGHPGRREAPRSSSFDKTSRTVVFATILGNIVFIILFFLECFFKNSVKTAVPDDGRPPGALVLTRLVERYRFEVGQKKI